MPRNMSFSLTTNQIRNRTKTVTRRIGWKNLRKGEIVNACVKCMGLKPGEKIERICQIRIVMVTKEPLSLCTNADAIREGFPAMTGREFVAMFCKNMKCKPDAMVNRIEFEYVEDDQ